MTSIGEKYPELKPFVYRGWTVALSGASSPEMPHMVQLWRNGVLIVECCAATSAAAVAGAAAAGQHLLADFN